MPAASEHTAPTKPVATPTKARRLRKRTVRLVALCLCSALLLLFWRYAKLKIDTHPTPNVKAWEARFLAELRKDARVSAMSAAEADSLMNNLPWKPRFYVHRFREPIRNVFPSHALRGEWDLTRPNIQLVDRELSMAEFRTARDALAKALEQGWQEDLKGPSRKSHIALSDIHMVRDLEQVVVLPSPGRCPAHSYGEWKQWLLADARRSLAVEDDWPQAAADWLSCCRLVRQAQQLRCSDTASQSIAWTMSISREMLLEALEGDVQLSTSEFAAHVDEALGPVLKPSELLGCQRLITLMRVDCICVADGGWLDIAEAKSFSGGQRGTNRLWNLCSFIFHDANEIRSVIDDYYHAMDAARTIPDCWTPTYKALCRRGGSRLGVLDGWKTTTLEEEAAYLVDDYYLSRMSMDAALAALALSAYHIDHDAYPDRLEQLIPDYLHRLPIDYADLQPLRYRRAASSYVLYSIGPDGRDDNAVACEEDGAPTADLPIGDWVYSAARRDPPRASARQTADGADGLATKGAGEPVGSAAPTGR